MELMLIVIIVSLLILTSGLIFKKIHDFYLTEPLVAVIVGILVGPDVLGLIPPTDATHEFKVLKIACEFTMAIALMATALRLPTNFFRKNAATQSKLVILGMILMWLFSSGILYFILGDFSITECLLIGAIITPTDPVVASTIVTGSKAEKYLPAKLRNTLSFESGVNDGLAFPLVVLGILLYQKTEFPFQEWVLNTFLYKTVLCGILAWFVGLFAGKLMHKAHEAKYMDTKSLLSFSIALALLLLAGFDLLKMNGIFAVFIGGLGFAQPITKNEDLKQENVQESMERIFLIPVFFIFGIMLPWQEWFSMGWTALGIVVLILVFRRIPAFLLLMLILSDFKKKIKDILIMGWFGPIGVAALFYSVHSREKTGFEEAWVIPALVVFASTVIHGITSVPFEKLYYRKKKDAD